MQRVEADLLIPGRGEPIRNGCVILDGDRITFAGAIEDAAKGSGVETIRVPVVMPGMWECHGHFLGLKTGNIEEIAKTPVQVAVARAAKDAERSLQAGFTSVREVGGHGVYLARAVDEGTVAGPHIYGAGATLSVTGGHGDLHMFPLEFVTEFGPSFGLSVLCDGVPGCLRGVRLQLRAGAKIIKVLASGGVLSELDHPVHQQFSDEELRAIVEEAARAERVVAAHCHGKPGIVAALRAGCRTIEHGTYLDEETADMMLQKNAILVPTRFIIERLLKLAKKAGVPDYAYEKLMAISGRHKEAMRLAVRQGVRIALGTDIYSSGDATPVPWGMNAHELLHLAEAGLSPLEAIEAATANGPLTLGTQAQRSGRLEAGCDGDVIAVAENPLTNLGVLTNPAKITHVWKAGILVKAPTT